MLTLLIFAMTSFACRDASTDCWWGFELLAVVPVLIVCWFVAGLASPFALWFVLAVLVRGVLPMFVALVVVTFAVPAVVAVLTAPRRRSSAGEAGDVAGR